MTNTKVKSGGNSVGGLIGYLNDSILSNIYVAGGAVTSSGNNVGGIVGNCYEGSISRFYVADATIAGSSSVGAVTGYNEYCSPSNYYAYGNSDGSGNNVSGNSVAYGTNVQLSTVLSAVGNTFSISQDFDHLIITSNGEISVVGERVCSTCPIGYYCIDDAMNACPDGETTASTGSTSENQCICDSSMNLTGRLILCRTSFKCTVF